MLKKIFYILLVVAILMFMFGASMYFWFQSGGMQEYVLENYGKQTIQNDYLYEIIRDSLGFQEEKHILLLFLNNTELRPGGGFIGSYAVISTQNGTPHLLKVEGTEIIDNYAASYLESVPPRPLKDYLGVEKWFFRDSNWSPDFEESAKKSLELYIKEKGVAADKIDYVLGLTPTVIREILKITGPIKVGEMEFNAENFIEKLQWEVEYGYAKKGVSFDERKKTLQDLTKAVLFNFGRDFLKYNEEFMNLAKRMLSEKQIIVYAIDEKIQDLIKNGDWSGRMYQTNGDFLLWADANLGALKTDLVMERNLSYTIIPTSSNQYFVRATMKYVHKGEFDWRTTRYRTYTRIFVPQGSKLIGVKGAMFKEKSLEPAIIEEGLEKDKQWFGTFIAIEPGKTGELTFEFYLSPKINSLIKEGKYELLVQKQLGTESHGLTLNLDFGKKVSNASPSEDTKEFGDNIYKINTDLRLDKSFNIVLE